MSSFDFWFCRIKNHGRDLAENEIWSNNLNCQRKNGGLEVWYKTGWCKDRQILVHDMYSVGEFPVDPGVMKTLKSPNKNKISSGSFTLLYNILGQLGLAFRRWDNDCCSVMEQSNTVVQRVKFLKKAHWHGWNSCKGDKKRIQWLRQICILYIIARKWHQKSGVVYLVECRWKYRNRF